MKIYYFCVFSRTHSPLDFLYDTEFPHIIFQFDSYIKIYCDKMVQLDTISSFLFMINVLV